MKNRHSPGFHEWRKARDAQVLEWRDSGLTYVEIGRRLNVSRGRVRQIETRGLMIRRWYMDRQSRRNHKALNRDITLIAGTRETHKAFWDSLPPDGVVKDETAPFIDWEDLDAFPLSQVTDDSEVCEEGDKGNLIVTLWIASEKELL